MKLTFAEKFNLAEYFLYDRLQEGLGAKSAVLYGSLGYTYADIAERSRALAAYFSSVGLEPGQRVYIVLPDTPPFVWSIFASWTAGAVLTMGNPAAKASDLSSIINYIEPSILITVPKLAKTLIPELKKQRCLKSVLLVPDTATGEDPEQAIDVADEFKDLNVELRALTDAIRIGAKRDWQPPSVHRDDMACWLFTSGSTGTPKAAMHTHRDFAFNTECYAKRTVGFRRDDITVSVPRLFFGYATGTNLWFPFAVGATTGLFSESPDPASLARAIALYRPTIITNVPTMLGKLLVDTPDIDMSSVRFQLSAGEALPGPLLERVLDKWDSEVYDGIGSAEMFHIYCSNRPGDVRAGSLGRVVEGYELRVLPADADGPGAGEIPAGDTGVLWVKGDSVSMAYFRDREKSWSTFFGHWCRTGDLFTKDKDGYLYFCGRADDLFKVNGRWVAPQEIEECLIRHPQVAACVVIPFELDGLIKPKAIVVAPHSSQDEVFADTLKSYARQHIAKYKYPREIEFIDDLPKNDRGKIDRKALRRTGL